MTTVTAESECMGLPPDAGDLAETPDISVIIPVFEQWDMARDLLRALGRQSLHPARYEVLIVDNGASPPALSADLLACWPGNCRLLHCPTPGSYAARSLGVAEARAPWLAFTDADCQPDARWLDVLLAEIEGKRDPQLLLAGDIRMAMGPAPRTPWAIYDFVKGIPQQAYVRRGYAATANLCVSRAAYDQIGGFDTSRFSGGDADFCRRAVAAGNRLTFLPSAYVWHPTRTRWEELAIKARRIKGGQHHKANAQDPTSTNAGHRPGWLRQLYWLSPLSLMKRWAGLLSRSHVSLRFRLIACGVCVRIWGVELQEAWRLARGGQAERR